MLRRLAILGVLTTLVLAAVPASGQAATNFGSRLKNDPTEKTCEIFGKCTIVSFIHPIDPEGEPYSGGAPVGGVITRFRVRAFANDEPGQITFRVADINLPDPNDNTSAVASITGSGPTITINPDEMAAETPITEVGGRLPVRKGQHLAVDATRSIGVVYNSNGNKYSYVFSPALADGAAARASTDVTNELLVAATIEPDADKDGFGDETQDQCPRQATTQGPCDDTKPRVINLKVVKGKASYTLSEAADVSLLLEKKFVGRKVGKRCVRRTARNSSKKRCVKFRKVGAVFSGPGTAGAHRIKLPNGKKLKPGAYRLTVTARDAAGNETKKTTRFKIKAKKKKHRKKS